MQTIAFIARGMYWFGPCMTVAWLALFFAALYMRKIRKWTVGLLGIAGTWIPTGLGWAVGWLFRKSGRVELFSPQVGDPLMFASLAFCTLIAVMMFKDVTSVGQSGT